MSSLYSELENLYDQDFMNGGDGNTVLEWLIRHREEIDNIEIDYLNDISNAQEKVAKLEHRLSNCIELPVKIGNSVYKICPKCNDNHNGSCKNCAWGGCFSGNCDVGVGVWSDGSYTEKPLQIVEKKITDNNISNVYDWWNIMFFDNEIKARQAMEEYDQIRTIEDKSERVERFRDWYNSRKIKNPLKLEELKK